MRGDLATSDGELFERTRNGDRAAFGELVDRHKDGLVNYLTYLGGRRTEAEDLAQEAFLRLYEQRARYREQGKLRTYLYRIATNLQRSQVRRERRWERLRQLFFACNGRPAEPTPQSRALRHELGQQLSAALRQVPLHYRTPLVLATLEGWSHREIAELLQCRLGTVKSRIHRARQLMRNELESYRNGATP